MGGELFTLFAKLTLDTSEFDKNTDGAKQRASVFGDVLKADLVGKGISAAISGLKQLGGMVANFAKDAVMSYGEVEQLRGGIETLFGDSAQRVLADADKAFKTAGMSAADYMDTSIQSAASLINSLGGDQAKAAELMNMSITDMADNVNKMGTSMEAVQNAYRGFSRGNFTMLDNLALGFAGTKEGMQELLDKAQEISGVEYDISSYSDIVEAIHVVQDEMGITGTTAKEAAETIQGSLSSMKSAWKNLVAGIADPEADLGTLVGNLVESAETALDNVIPAAERAFNGMGDAIAQIVPMIAQRVPELVKAGGELVKGLSNGISKAMSQFSFKSDVVPLIVKLAAAIRDNAGGLVDAGLGLIEGLVSGITGNTSYLIVTGHQIIESLIGTFTDNVPRLFEAGLEMLQGLGQGISENIPSFLESVLPLIEQFTAWLRESAGNLVDVGIDFILNIAQGIMDSLPLLIEQVPQIVINIANIINDNAPKLLFGGAKLIAMLLQGILQSVPTILQNIPKIFEMILAVWSALNWINLGKQVINFIKNGIEMLQTQLPTKLQEIGQKAIDWFKGVNWANAGRSVINFLHTAISSVASLIPNILKSIGGTAIDFFKSVDWLGAGSKVIGIVINGISSVAGKVADKLKSIGEDAWDAFCDINWFDLGSNVISGIVDGLRAGVDWIKDAARDVAQRAKDAAESLLGISSPSKVFRDEVGLMISKGLAIGIDKGAVDAIEAAERLSEDVLQPFGSMDTVGVTAGTNGFSDSITQAIRANNDGLINGLYAAMSAALTEADFTVEINGREFHRILREAGAL